MLMSENKDQAITDSTEISRGNRAIKVFTAIFAIIMTAAILGLIANLLIKPEEPSVTAIRVLKLVIAGNKEKLKKMTFPGNEQQIDKIPALPGVKPEQLVNPNPSLTIESVDTYKTVFYVLSDKYEYQVGIILKKSGKKWKISQLIIDKKNKNRFP
jgi:hypothetical protein